MIQLRFQTFLENRFKDRTKILRFVSAIVILVFFTFYASAGLVSGGRLFENSFNLDYKIGLFVTVGVVVAYTLFGGFLAVSWTDFVQGCIMFIALVLVPIVAFTDVGGVTETYNTIKQVDASHLDMFKRDHNSWYYFLFSMGSWVFWSTTYYCPLYGNYLY